MSTGDDRGLPDFDSRDPYGDPGAHSADPAAAGPAPSDPYASDPYGGDPYSGDPYGGDPYSGDPYATHAVGSPQHPHPVGPPQHPYPAGPPVYGAFPPPLPSSNAAITGFVLGLVGLVMCMGVTSPFGIWYSARGLRETEPTATPPRGGHGLAVAGMALSLLGLLPLLILVAYVAFIVIGIAATMSA